ncbi:MAG: acetylglutamate kinase [Elusimicrobiota bacterium]|jgi:acetylglutamate kinase|nr:acetylglutamate kinase [Elusimicrobiota bacterium]
MPDKNKIVVIKFGGSLFVNENNRFKFWEDIKNLIEKKFFKIVIVHGGGKEISNWLERLEVEVKFVNGLRYTDEKSIEIVEMVLSGKINKQLASEISSFGVSSIGISGRDSKLVLVKQKLELGRVGEPIFVNSEILNKLLKAGILPIISPISTDADRKSFNVNADDFASIIAQSINADNLIFMTDMKGVLANIKDENSVIYILNKAKADELIEKSVIKDGMLVKIKSAFSSLENGIREINIVDGREFGIIEKIFGKNEKKLIGTRIIR